jgi:hypothetical protein
MCLETELIFRAMARGMGRGDEEVCFDGVLGTDMDFPWTFFHWRSSDTNMAHIACMHWVSRCIRMDTIIESLTGLPTSKISLLPHFTHTSIYCYEWVNTSGNESVEAEEW